MTLYRLNLRLSQELFTIISIFEVTLRNRICEHYTSLMGDNWLRDTILPGGAFDIPQCARTKNIIRNAYVDLRNQGQYNHFKLMTEMDFGVWRYLFAKPQFRAAGQSLLHIFRSKPASTRALNYNHTFVFNQLGKINELRNRIAHHEPVCFAPGAQIRDTGYVRQHYNLILQLFQWMQIDEGPLLYGLDHINTICNCIDAL